MIVLAASLGALMAMALSAPRLFIGPTLQDRTLAANAIVGKAALICAAASVMAQRAEWIDAAFALLLACYVANVAILKFFRLGSFQAPLTRKVEP